MIAYVTVIVDVAPSDTLSFALFLRRIAVVDYRGQTIYSAYVQPTNTVTDYRTSQTGITPDHLKPGE